jgi:hypothetical protein
MGKHVDVRRFLNRKPKTNLLIAVVTAVFASSLGFAQSVFFHLLGASDSVAAFTSASQTFSESNGTFGEWPSALSAWSSRRRIILEGSTASALSNFPAMIKLNSSRITYASVKAGGQDLRFADDAGNLLPFEIEKWDVAGDSFVWVKVPVLKAASQRTSLWMYYGNSAATDSQNLAGLWSTIQNKVFHFDGTLGAAVANSSAIKGSAGTDGTATNGGSGMSYAASPMGTGIAFDGVDDRIAVGGDSNLNFAASAPFTFSAFLKTTDTSGPLIMFRDSSGGANVLGIYIGQNGASFNSGKVNLLVRDSTGNTYAQLLGPTINDGIWHDIAMTRNAGNSISLFVDGVSYGSASASGTGGAFTTDLRAIGTDLLWVSGGTNSANDRWLSGTIDEVRIAPIQYGLDYFVAQHAMAADLMAYYGAEEAQSSGLVPVTIQLSSPALTSVTIPYSVSGTATSLVDHTAANGNIVIPSGQSSGALPIRVLRDEIVEPNETAILTLGTPTGASLGSPSVHTITITDEVLAPPDAVDDAIDITSLAQVTLPVLLNDTDPNGDLLLITSFTAPSAGALVKVGSSFLFTPSADFAGTDSFTYTISDGRGGSDTATVTLNFKIPFTWLGAAGDLNWTTPANWLGGAVPGVADTAYFNDQCALNCVPTLTGAINVGGLRLNSSYTGTISQGANVFTLGSAGYRQSGGTFTGGSVAFTSALGFSVTGGTFTSTSAELKTSTGDFIVRAPGIFAANGGNLFIACVYGTTCKIEPSTGDFNNVKLAGNYSWFGLSGGTMNVNGSLSIGDTYAPGYYGQPVNNGTFNLKGDYFVINNGMTGTATVRMAGNIAGQTITGMANAFMPRLQIDAGPNTVTFSGSIGVPDIYTYTSGTLVTTGSTLRVHCSYGLTCAFTAGIQNYNNVTLSSYYGNFDLVGGTVNVLGQLTIGDTFGSGYLNQKMNNGTFNAYGGISISPFGYRGNVVINSLGANTTISTGTPVAIPDGNFAVNKTLATHTLTFGSNVTFGGAGQAFTLTKGIVDLAGRNLGVNGLLTVASGSKIVCNGGVITAGSTSILGELSCGTSIGITWTGATGDGLWTTAGNWTDGLVPGASDVALFTSICGANCNVSIPSNLSVRGVSMAAGFPGTITQASGATITVGAAGWIQSGGTFVGSNAAVAMTEKFQLSGGTYTATSASTSLGTPSCGAKEVLRVTGGIFNHGNGRLVVLQARSNGSSCNGDAQLYFPPGFAVYDFELNATPQSGGWISNAVAMNATTLLVENRFYDYGQVLKFNLDVEGDVFFENTNNELYSANPDGVIRLMGTGDQKYSSSGSTPSGILKVDKATGLVEPEIGISNLNVFALEVAQGSFTAPIGNLTLGKVVSFSTSMDSLKVAPGSTYNVNGSTTRFALRRYSSAGATGNVSVPAGFTFNNVELIGEAPGGGWYDVITSSTELLVAGNLTFAGHVNNADWAVEGNLIVSGNAYGGTGTIALVGLTSQTVTGVPAAYCSKLKIKSAGGTVTFAGNLIMAGDFSYASGVVDAGTSDIHFDATYRTMAIDAGPITFNKVNMLGYVGTLNITGVVDVAGALTLGGSSTSPTLAINGGIIKARSDVTVASVGASGTMVLQMAGGTNQTLSASNNILPNLEINSTGGTVTFGGALKLNGNYTHTQGVVDAGTSTIQFQANGQTLATDPGPTVFNNINFSGYVANYNLANPLKVGGVLTISSVSASPAQTINGATLEAAGNVIFGASGTGGTSPLKMNGATATTLSIGGSAAKMSGLFTIEKTGGSTVFLAQDSSFNSGGQDLTVASGVFDLAGYVLTVNDVLTVSSGATLRCSDGSFTSLTVANSGAIECLGYSSYPYNWTGAAADGKWSTAGNWSGGAVPNSTSTALFKDEFCLSNCDASFDVSPSVRGIELRGPYSGTVTQAPGIAVSIGNRGWKQYAGTFAGGDSSFVVNGAFVLSGGTFTATSATSSFKGNFTVSGSPTFNHGSGLIAFDDNQTIIPNGITANNLRFGGTTGQSLSNGTINVNGTLDLSDSNVCCNSLLNSGTINARGNVVVTNYGRVGSAVVRIVGNTNQTITGSANGRLPSLVIASTGGNVTLVSTVNIGGDFTYTSGNVVSTGASVVFGSSAVIRGGGLALDTVTISGTAAQDLGGETLNVNSTLTLDDASVCCNSAVNNGTLLLNGNLNVTGYGKGGTALVKLTGGANQIVTGSTNAKVPKFEIASVGGTVTINNSIRVTDTFKYTSGTVDAIGSTFVFADNATLTTGPVIFGNVTVGGTSVQNLNGGTMIVQGKLTLDDSNSCCGSAVNNGTIELRGDLMATNYGKSGTASLQWTGTALQTVTQGASAALPSGARSVNKTGGKITQASNVAFTGANSLTITAGTWDMAGYSLSTTGAIANNGVLQRGLSPTCGTITAGSYTGTAAVCP